MLYFRLDDQGKVRGVYPVHTNDEAIMWNDKGWGIFFTMNEFEGNVRQIIKCTKIRTWLVDIDIKPNTERTKATVFKQISQAPLLPSMVNESKNGYHCYWYSKDATMQNWKEIEARLIDYFQADVHVSDVTRILRAPKFYHCKDIDARFMVKTVMQNDVRYSEAELLTCFPKKKMVSSPAKISQASIEPHTHEQQGDFWEKVHEIPCDQALLLLSGRPEVCGETIELKDNRNGTKQIWCNGKSTGCWVDQDRKIGGNGGGAPNIGTWLNWYQNDWKKTSRIIKDLFGGEFNLCK